MWCRHNSNESSILKNLEENDNSSHFQDQEVMVQIIRLSVGFQVFTYSEWYCCHNVIADEVFDRNSIHGSRHKRTK